MGAVELAIDLLEEERAATYELLGACRDRLTKLDMALAQLKAIGGGSDVSKLAASAKSVPARKGAPPAAAQRGVSPYTEEEKKRAVDLAIELGSDSKAAKKLGIGQPTISKWRRDVGKPAVARQFGPKHPAPLKPGRPDATPAVKDLPAPPRLVPVKPAVDDDNDPPVRCSCGKNFPSRKAWQTEHNAKLKPSEFRDHKLQVAS